MKTSRQALTSLLIWMVSCTVSAQNFRTLRDVEWQKDTIDLSSSLIDIMPRNALHSCRRLKCLILPPRLKEIGEQALFGCDQIHELELPDSLTSIGKLAFGGMKSLRQITCLSEIPPTLDDETFAGTNITNIRLSIPEGCREAYSKAPVWERFFSKTKIIHEHPQNLCITPIPASIQYLGTGRLNIPEHGLPEAMIKRKIDSGIGHNEGYTLRVDKSGIHITGNDEAGLFYGEMTLLQMLTPSHPGAMVASLPYLTITDFPRTRIRELMVDPCRIFIPFDDLKSLIPLMARFKLNALHIHLVDDQAWRIEIKKYPLLTLNGSSRTGMDDMQIPISGYYTQDEMRELVAYAREYHIEIIPEIEMPGHEVAAIHCYPQLTCNEKKVPVRTTCGVSNELLCPSSEFTFRFLKDVFNELSTVFSSKYVHLGGDEAGNPPLKCWSDCANCQRLLSRLTGKGEDQTTPYNDGQNWKLQEYLFKEITTFLRDTLQKTPMFWYETDFKEIPSGCITFAWRHGLTQAAIDAARRNDARIILCPGEHCYLDYPAKRGDMPEVNWGMPVTTLEQTYRLDPAWENDESFEQVNLMGVAGTLWSECIPSITRLYYMAFPRAIALAEAGWSQQSRRNWKDFLQRIQPVVRDLHDKGICTGPQ